MKKKVVIIVLVLAVAAVGVAAFMALNNSRNTDGGKATSFKQLDACALFTEADAKAVMGEAATAGIDTPPAKTDDINLTNCSYTNNATDVKQIKVATVTVRAPLTQAGVDSNKDAFGNQRPANAENLDGYGEDALWDPEMHQLYILKDNNWISIVYGGTNPSSNTVADARVIADKVMAHSK